MTRYPTFGRLGAVVLAALVAASCGSHGGTSAATANRDAAKQLASLKQRVDRLDGRLIDVQLPQTVNQKTLKNYADRLQPVISDYARLAQSAAGERSKLSPYSDSDVHRAWNLLVRRSKLVASNFQAMADDLRKDDLIAFDSKLKAAESKRKPIDSEFQALSNKIASRYGP